MRLANAIWSHPANRGRKGRALLRAFTWQLDKRLRSRPWIVPFHGLRLICYPDSTSSSAVVYFNGLPDYWEMSFLRAYLRAGDHVLDVGANVGIYTVLAAARVGPRGSVDALEPQEAAAARIEAQASLNGLHNIRVHRYAASGRSETAAFGYSAESATRHLRRETEASGDGIQVLTMRLDELEPGKQYALGKMDIEGAEPLALRGAVDRLRHANPPVWLLEMAGYSKLYGVSTEELIASLADAGFDTAVWDPETRRLRYTKTPWTLGVQNVLAVARQRAQDVAVRANAMLQPKRMTAPVKGG
jgi:FkbM family methyltransferase